MCTTVCTWYNVCACAILHVVYAMTSCASLETKRSRPDLEANYVDTLVAEAVLKSYTVQCAGLSTCTVLGLNTHAEWQHLASSLLA